MNKYLITIIICLSCISAQINRNAKTKLQSLLLPGWGELALGESKRANEYFIREAALWLIFIGSKKTAAWYESDYKAFAELHAGVNMDAKDYIFAVNMGHYNSFTEYNETKARQRQVDNIYEEGQGNEWQWDTNHNRIRFDNMRIQSVIYNKYVSFAIGGLVLHRLISLIDVIYLESRFPKISVTPEISTNTGHLQFKLQLYL